MKTIKIISFIVVAINCYAQQISCSKNSHAAPKIRLQHFEHSEQKRTQKPCPKVYKSENSKGHLRSDTFLSDHFLNIPRRVSDSGSEQELPLPNPKACIDQQHLDILRKAREALITPEPKRYEPKIDLVPASK